MGSIIVVDWQRLTKDLVVQRSPVTIATMIIMLECPLCSDHVTHLLLTQKDIYLVRIPPYQTLLGLYLTFITRAVGLQPKEMSPQLPADRLAFSSVRFWRTGLPGRHTHTQQGSALSIKNSVQHWESICSLSEVPLGSLINRRCVTCSLGTHWLNCGQTNGGHEVTDRRAHLPHLCSPSGEPNSGQ